MAETGSDIAEKSIRFCHAQIKLFREFNEPVCQVFPFFSEIKILSLFQELTTAIDTNRRTGSLTSNVKRFCDHRPIL
jgi:hypothetical protein